MSILADALQNRDLNRLHLHYGLIRFAEQFTTVFGLVVLYQLGYPLWQVFAMWGTMFAVRMALRLFVPTIIARVGLRRTITMGTMNYIALLPVLYLATLNILPMWVYLIFFSATCALYWLPFHILYGLIGDAEKRGRQSAIREAYARLAHVIAPLIAGVTLAQFGQVGLFAVGTGVFLLALVALRSIRSDLPDRPHFDWQTTYHHSSRRGFLISLYFSFWEMFFDYGWVFVLFFLFGEEPTLLGGVLSVILLARVVIDYFVGGAIDTGQRMRWFVLGGLVIAAVVLGRVFFGFSLPAIIALDVLFMIGYSLFTPYESVLLYNSIKHDPSPTGFALLSETGWDTGSIIGSAILAAGAYAGCDIRYLLPIGLITVIAAAALFESYFFQRQKTPTAKLACP